MHKITDIPCEITVATAAPLIPIWNWVIKRISKPGMRVYTNAYEVPKVLNGLGISIISTSKGILTDRQARKENVGGEVICYVW